MKFLFILIFVNCLGKNIEQAKYWKEFYKIQNSIKSFSEKTKTWKIANGSLDPSEEFKLKKKENKYYLFFEAEVNSYEVVARENLVFNSLENYPNSYLYVEYEPSYFQSQETYIFKRTLRILSGHVFFPQDFLAWISQMQGLNNPKTSLEKDPLFQFLCDNFECEIQNETKQWSLNLSLSNNLKKFDKNFYNRIYKLLNKNQYLFYFLDSKTHKSIVQVMCKEQKIQIIWNKENKILPSLDSILLQMNLNINFYGLKIDIQNWKYGFEFERQNKTSILKGKFLNIPNYKLSGRLGYILPKQVLNFFIPDNLDEYFAFFFILRQKGNFGKGHTWKIQIQPFGSNQYEMYSITEAEIPKKSFRFLGGSSGSQEKEIFLETLQEKIVSSLFNNFLN